jgi:hypothetical protein
MTSQATADQVPRLDPFSQRAGVALRRKDLRMCPRSSAAAPRSAPQAAAGREARTAAGRPAGEESTAHAGARESRAPSLGHAERRAPPLEQPAGEDIQQRHKQRRPPAAGAADATSGSTASPPHPTAFLHPTPRRELLRHPREGPAPPPQLPTRQEARTAASTATTCGGRSGSPRSTCAGCWHLALLAGTRPGCWPDSHCGHPGSPAPGALAAGLRPADHRIIA